MKKKILVITIAAISLYGIFWVGTQVGQINTTPEIKYVDNVTIEYHDRIVAEPELIYIPTTIKEYIDVEIPGENITIIRNWELGDDLDFITELCNISDPLFLASFRDGNWSYATYEDIHRLYGYSKLSIHEMTKISKCL